MGVVVGRRELEHRAELRLGLVPALDAEVRDAERLADRRLVRLAPLRLLERTRSPGPACPCAGGRGPAGRGRRSRSRRLQVREVLLHQVKRIRQISRRADLDGTNLVADVDRGLERVAELVRRPGRGRRCAATASVTSQSGAPPSGWRDRRRGLVVTRPSLVATAKRCGGAGSGSRRTATAARPAAASRNAAMSPGAKTVSAADDERGGRPSSARARRRPSRRRSAAGRTGRSSPKREPSPTSSSTCSARWPVTTATRSIPAPRAPGAASPSTGRPSIGSTGFGQRSVSGRRRRPSPGRHHDGVHVTPSAERADRDADRARGRTPRRSRLRSACSIARSSRAGLRAPPSARRAGGPKRAAVSGRRRTAQGRRRACVRSTLAELVEASRSRARRAAGRRGSPRARAEPPLRPGADRASGSARAGAELRAGRPAASPSASEERAASAGSPVVRGPTMPETSPGWSRPGRIPRRGAATLERACVELEVRGVEAAEPRGDRRAHDGRVEVDRGSVYGPSSCPRPGVGSNGSQPSPRNQTSTHACASWSTTVQRRFSRRTCRS